ncbi:hypothetical protein HAX54_028007 [Datura stramonium]|uniref:Myosin motor domain-containing protein n=1 Tax=Datura stramonium TaxID=4076 RepID=A0ABS8Y670_DATST|nr:hypothetical protein [Datura stramonium]
METLSSTEPHYIRCVKPNSLNRPQKFENLSILHQLRCGGVLEAVRISLAGYPTRRTYHEFIDRFGLIVLDMLDGSLLFLLGIVIIHIAVILAKGRDSGSIILNTEKIIN